MSNPGILASLMMVGLALLPAMLPRAASATAHVWRRADVRRGVGGAAVRVVAVESQDAASEAGARIALAGESGATLWLEYAASDAAATAGRTGRAERIPRVGAVQDLHFARDGTLWIATARGLWRLDVSGRLEDRSPAPGEAARFVHRVVSLPGLVLATTQAGAYWTQDGQRWKRLADLPLGPAGPIAARLVKPAAPSDASLAEGLLAEVWLVAAGALRRLELRSSGSAPTTTLAAATTGVGTEAPSAPAGWRVSHSQREASVVGIGAGALPLQILLDLPDADSALVYEDAIAIRPHSAGPQGAADDSGAGAPSVGWQIVRPVLPPEAKATWLAAAGDGYWLATDGGLMRAAALRGPYHRAAPPAGASEVFRVVVSEERVLAASGRGLLIGEAQALGIAPRDSRSSPPHVPIATLLDQAGTEPDPPIQAVQRAALRYLGLEMEHVRGLRRGVSRRGWLPLLNLKLGAAYDRDTADDYDQAFLSGETRNLHDRDGSRGRDFDASLSLTWDLGDVAYDPEAIDLSREARQLITLRDDVLDQINQAYYERQALLHALASAPAEGAPTEIDRRKLQLRADELAAGLDGWTGGWFGRERTPPAGKVD